MYIFLYLLTLGIGNIPATLEPVDLENIFSRFGSIESARVLSHKNCGFINFVRLEDAAEAKKQMNGKEISGATVKIGFAKVPNSNSVTPTVSVLPETDNESNTYSANVNTNPTSAWPRLLATSNAVNHASGSSAYSFTVPSLPQSDNRLDNNILRDFRKRLENSNTSLDQVAEIFNSVISDAATVAAGNYLKFIIDYIGNVVIQKLIEKGTDDQRFQIIHMIAPYIATIGIHKNGTWAIQKILGTLFKCLF
jgi:RNA recognition motif-containing protein